MNLAPGCPRCATEVESTETSWTCGQHGPVVPLWRTARPGYDDFGEHLRRAEPLPSWVVWPLPPGWQVLDFGVVGRPGEDALATVLTFGGPSEADGVVEMTVVTEEPGVGLGARCAATSHSDPGSRIGGPSHARVRLDNQQVQLWSVSTSDDDPRFDRSVFAGEAHGRWLWVVLRPASAALMLTEPPLLVDVSALGPELVDLPFGEVPRAW